MSRTSKESNGSIRVLLVDDHPVVREGIRACLTGHDRLEIVGEAIDGDEAVQLTRDLRPDVVLMDINMPGTNGIEATRAIISAGLPSRVVILTVVNNQEYVAEMIRCGAKGYVLKDAHPDELIEAVIAVHEGSLYYLVKENVPNPPVPTVPPADLHGVLSGREIQVLKRVAEGWTSKDIARETDLSVRTVKTYRERIMRKAGLRSVADMVKYAIEHRLITSGKQPAEPAHPSATSLSKDPPRPLAGSKSSRRKKA
jgi:two-component system nitrate/nitrite response regulator NarL